MLQKSKKFLAAVALLSIELLIVWILFFSSIILFALFAYRVFSLKKDDIDTSVFNLLSNHVSATNTRLMEVVTFLGTQYFLVPAYILLIIYFLFIKKHKWYSIKIPVVAIGGVSLMLLLKYLFSRPRPLIPLLSKARGFSFPSGHAMMSFAFYGLLIFLVWENVQNKFLRLLLTVILLFIIFLIGLSRIYLRVHYASDVVAGFAAGIIWVVCSIWIIRSIEIYSRKKVDRELDNNLSDRHIL